MQFDVGPPLEIKTFTCVIFGLLMFRVVGVRERLGGTGLAPPKRSQRQWNLGRGRPLPKFHLDFSANLNAALPEM